MTIAKGSKKYSKKDELALNLKWFGIVTFEKYDEAVDNDDDYSRKLCKAYEKERTRIEDEKATEAINSASDDLSEDELNTLFDGLLDEPNENSEEIAPVSVNPLNLSLTS